MSASSDRVIRLMFVCRDVDEFDRLCELVAPLGRFGRLQVDIQTLAEPTPYDLPAGGSPWHEYLAYLPGLVKVVPHPLLQPYLNMEHVRRNRELLESKVAILKNRGLEAYFDGPEPAFWPEAFFMDHPHMRGPRVDHPRRSRLDAFAPCTDEPQVRDMFRWMVAELKRTVPMLGGMTFRANDVGSGFCWCSALYTGRHGPSHCESVDPGSRVAQFMETLQQGARDEGGEIRITCNGNFYNNEVYTIAPKLGEKLFLSGWKSDSLTLYSKAHDPIRGYVRPAAIIAAAARSQDNSIGEYNVDFAGSYQQFDREGEQDISNVVALLCELLKKPAGRSLRARHDRLYELCATWAGDQADNAYEALLALHDADAIPTGKVSTLHMGVNLRYMVRPLVIRPEELTAEEEGYFLPYVFNPDPQQARTDYADVHGKKFAPMPSLRQMTSRLRMAADRLDAIADLPDDHLLRRLAKAVRIRLSIVRSVDNFLNAQALRDRFAAQLAQPHLPEKDGTFDGEPGNLEWNAIQRDELENAGELLAVLEGGGLDQVSRAPTPELESMFSLPPDLAAAVRKKIEVMRAHWRDVEPYLAPPMK